MMNTFLHTTAGNKANTLKFAYENTKRKTQVRSIKFKLKKMKHLKFFKQLSLSLMLMIASQFVSGQTITSVTGGDPFTTIADHFESPCGPSPTNFVAGSSATANFSGPITITWSEPVYEVNIPYASHGNGTSESHRFDANGVTDEVVTPGCATITVFGNLTTGTNSDGHSGYMKIESVTGFTSLTITREMGFAMFIPDLAGLQADPFVTPSSCTAGTTAPSLSATTKANTCPATTVDLTTLTASNTPAGTTLTWHTGTPATTANKVTGTAVAAGTYYAAFFDATNDCYSGTAGDGTTAVTATVSACCNAGIEAPIFGN